MADFPAPRPAAGWFTFRVDVNTLILSLLLALTTWGASQFVEVRDTVRSLRDTVPIRFQALEHRVDQLEIRR